MSLKVKALALGCLAMLATASVAVDASGTAGGHFTSNREKTTFESIQQNHTFGLAVGGKAISCEETTFHGIAVGTTFTGMKLTPTLKKCKTAGEAAEFNIDANGCSWEFTVKAPKPEEEHSTLHLLCPVGASMSITHPSCTMHVAPQTLTGVTYTKSDYQGTDTPTIDFTVKNIQYGNEGGICVFLGTNHNDLEFTGDVLAKAWEEGKYTTVGASVNAT